jgi:ribulose-5-phosphate 4-epimerase/fuculose-1-phosphate aldolase
MIVDEKGVVLEGKHTVEPTAFFIHGRIHLGKRKPVVLHTHMPFATSLAITDNGRLDTLANQNAMRFHGRVSYDEEFGGVVLDNAEGDRLCRALGDADIMFLAYHGVIVCGPNMAYAFDDLYYLERSCMVQVLAESTGKPLRKVDEAVAARVGQQIGGERQQSLLHFEALKRLLDRDEPGWAKAR